MKNGQLKKKGKEGGREKEGKGKVQGRGEDREEREERPLRDTEERIRIGYFNTNRCSDYTAAVLESAQKTFHIVFVAEPYVDSRKVRANAGTISHPSYENRTAIKRETKIIVYVRKDINARIETRKYHINVEVDIEDSTKRVTGVYFPPGLDDESIQTYLEGNRFQTVTMGDFNAHHPDWSIGGKENTRGKIIQGYMENQGFECKNPRTVTRKTDSSESCLDLIFSRDAGVTLQKEAWFGSDHALITLNYPTHLRRERTYKVIDWGRWEQ